MERLYLMNAVRNLERAKEFFEIPSSPREDVIFDLVELDKIKLGENFSVTVNIENKSSQVRTVKAAVSAATIFYTGIKDKVVKKASGTFKIMPNKKDQLKLVVEASEYMDKLVEYCLMKIYAIATVEETNETWADEDDFEVTKPKLDIQVTHKVSANEPATVIFSFTNPLQKTLTRCLVKYECPGVTKPQSVPFSWPPRRRAGRVHDGGYAEPRASDKRELHNQWDIGPEETVIIEHVFTAKAAAGEVNLVGGFSSRELVDITGSAVIEVF
ncbi:hypothetical protein PR048_003694 [Dryococelus australis]|uniref:Transglutaminase C-terminal domain-containing protein n=1 Tax=Dryococelus australis TaxID=614101 RepID=A0ABQ9INT3_9NEOP|nr:hypothetical protein PR048_003694 [Dryococelus australis]